MGRGGEALLEVGPAEAVELLGVICMVGGEEVYKLAYMPPTQMTNCPRPASFCSRGLRASSWIFFSSEWTAPSN